MQDPAPQHITLDTMRQRLKRPVTVTLPMWVLAGGGLLALVLLLAALD